MASQPLPLTLTPPPSLSSSSSSSFSSYIPTFHHHRDNSHTLFLNGAALSRLHRRRTSTIFLSLVPSVGKEDTDLRVSSQQEQQQDDEPTSQDLEYVAQIKRVSLILQKFDFF